MKRIILASLTLLILSLFSFAGFRVGDEWKPIPFFAQQFHAAGQGGGWTVTQAPPVFQYKDLGDTVLIDIRMQPEANIETTALVIQLPPNFPVPLDQMHTGLCTLYMGPNWDRTLAQYELYPTGIVIWPLTGMFPENKFPPGSIAVNLQLFYRH